MQSDPQPAPVSKKLFWVGWIVSALPALGLVVSSVGKLMGMEAVAKVLGGLGWDPKLVFGLGIVELACTAIYVFPRTSVLGAILLTGYLGGAVEAHIRVSDNQFVPPLVFGILVWLGLLLRDARLRPLLPLTR